ncbi:hypothetical protein EI94DRAFT_1716914 [Lactarius quietus]|nr:hypothetical protein EI94DRAFT_1716914 [Lactarius quietus]
MAHPKPRPTSQSSESVRKRTLWESYAGMLHDNPRHHPTLFTQSSVAVLPAKTRLKISLAVCAVAVAGIFVSDSLERTIPPPKEHSTEHPQ